MRLIVTGATGFVGRNLTAAMSRDGHDVVGTGRSLEVGAALERDGVEFRPADLEDADRLAQVFEPADCVLHCGGKSGPWGRYRDHFRSNVVGTRNVVAACRAHGIRRLVFVSTPSVYFTRRDRHDVAEDDPLPRRQLSHYSATKLQAERELAAVSGHALHVISLRPRALHGPWDRIFIPRILRMAGGPTFPLVDGGRARVDVTYIDNFVDAVRCCLSAPPEAWNEVYNVANGDPLTVRDWFGGQVEAFGLPFRPRPVPSAAARARAALMEAAARMPWASGPPRMTRASVSYLSWSMTMSIDKARLRLGYAPGIGNTEGFRLTAEWFRAHAERGSSAVPTDPSPASPPPP
jgi:nucleoside-diphosphate-sugar epimerase